MVQGSDCCCMFVSKTALLVATIFNAILLAASFSILCVGMADVCFSYDYYLDCSEKTAITIAGGVLTGIFTISFTLIIVLLFRMRTIVPTTPFMVPQPYATYGNPMVSTNNFQTTAFAAPYAAPKMVYPQQYP